MGSSFVTGVDFWSGISSEQRLRYEEIRKLAREVFEPIARAGDPHRVNRPLILALSERGILPRLFPARYGGTGQDKPSAVELCLLREALAWGSTTAETALALQGLGSYPILQFAAEEVAARWIPQVARGEAVAAFALTEPENGSDAGSLSLSAQPVDGGFRLTGTKVWISNAPEADVYTIVARTEQGKGPRGVTSFLIPAEAPGLTGEPLELLSTHPVGRLYLDGVSYHRNTRWARSILASRWR